jgi:hypothetical protein
MGDWLKVVIGVVGLLLMLGFCVWVLVALVDPRPSKLASSERKVRYWEDRLADLEHHRNGWRWAATPSESRREDEAIDEARMMLAAVMAVGGENR